MSLSAEYSIIKHRKMAKYIKKEMPDLSGKGKTGAYYRMATFSNIGT